ncbi:MAG: Rieske 2Fe-2S domain-containing protein [Anaerolineales bacterium]|nr:Rieske 2Fe-2S domain-containing protein [Anaerolineales bacterium]
MTQLNLDDYTFTLDPALAQTLPARWYTDPAFLTAEKEAIFWRTWQPVGRTADVRRPGDFFTCEVLGEPLVISRGKDNELRAFFNVCKHRAGPVAAGKGNRKSLQCKYHGWTYGLDGRLRNTPEFEGVQNWTPEQMCLTSVPVEAWGPFIFVNLNPQARPLGEALQPIADEVAAAGFNIADMTLAERRDYELDCNWKVYIDNYLEGYHIPIAHPGLFREIDYDQYRVETFATYSKQHAPMRPASDVDALDRDRRYMRTEAEEQALYYWLFPNVMLNFYPDNLQINIILPLGYGRTLTIFEWYFEQPGTGPGWESMQQSVAFSDQVQKEDIALCEAVQRGLQSQSYNQGRFSVKRENGVHHFHGLLNRYLRAAEIVQSR